MSTARLYFDADSMQRAVVSGLVARGIDALRAFEVGMSDVSDEEQLQFATSQGRVLFSFNASDFQRIHTGILSQNKIHAGIILASQQRYSIGDQIRYLLKLLNARSAEKMQNRLEFLSDWE